MTKWLEGTSHSFNMISDFYSTMSGTMQKYAARSGIASYEASINGVLAPEKTKEDLIAEVVSSIDSYSLHYEEKRSINVAHNNFCACITEHGTTTAFYMTALDRAVMDNLQAIGKKFLIEHEAKADLVFMLVRESGELYFKAVGVAGSELERGNYSDTVLRGYDHLLEEFGEEDPCGRLSIFVGPTGTGKTHLIRALLNTGSAYFAFLPPSMVPSIGSPDIVSSVLEFHRGHPGKPLCLVLEDADECLIPRGSDNIASISSILNASEGILGQIMDVRIIATTNAMVRDFDKAITRKGRMCSLLNVGRLSREQCNRILARLGVSEAADDDMTLGDVYFKARELGWKSAASTSLTKEKSKLGFTSE